MLVPTLPAPAPEAASTPELSVKRGKNPALRRKQVRSVATTGLFLLALLAALYFGRNFLMPVAFAITISMMLRPLVRGLHRCHVPAGLGAGIVVASVLGLLTVATVATYEPAMDWAERAPQTLHKVADKMRDLRRHFEDVGRAAAEVEKLTAPEQGRVPAVQIKGDDVQTTLARFTADAVGSAVIVVGLLYFLLATRARFLHKAFALLIQPAEGAAKTSIVADTEQNVSRYLFTITLINLVLGIAVAAAMWAWGMPNPLLWGAMATLLNFVPYLGAVTGTAITSVVAIVTFSDPRWAAVPLTYVLLTCIEGLLITPAILGRRFALDPVVVFVWLFFWGWLWGIGGALLATPMLVIMRIISERATALQSFGRLVSNGDQTFTRPPRGNES